MSTHETYAVRPYTKSSKPASSDHRLVRISWKETKDKITGAKKLARSPMCVSVPLLPIICTPAPLAAALQDAANEIVDSFIRARIEADYAVGKQPEPIANADLQPAALAAWFADEQSSKRLSKDSIGEWFDAEVQDKLLEVLAAKLSPDDPTADTKLAAASTQFRNMLLRLASPQASFTKQIAEQLESAVQLAESEDVIKSTLSQKLRKFTATQEDLLLSL